MSSSISASSGKPSKAYIWREDPPTGMVVECMFNPTEYNFSKSNTWNVKGVPGKDVPIPQFQSGGATTLTVSLLFDTYTQSTGGPPKDVRTYTEKVFGLMMVDSTLKDAKSKSSRPPIVTFHWGNSWSFKAVITSVAQKFSLFTSDGTPVRATLNVTFQQVEQQGTAPPTNPTSVAHVEKVHVVGPRETIDAIAFTELGDARKWPTIADYNNLDNPLKLRPGQKLAIPTEE
jgi:hypothetical protein